MIIGNNKEVKKIYKDNESIIDIKKGILPIYSRGSIMESLLTLPAKITALTKKILDLKLYGNTEQETTVQGKNLFDINKITANYALWGTGGGGTSSSTNTTAYMPVSANQQYTFSFDYTSLYASGYRAYELYNSSKTFVSGGSYNPTDKQLTITPAQAGYIRISYDKNCTSLQFEKGSKTSYEPFTPNSPSPDYPSEVKTITGRQEISVSGKNLFDKDTAVAGTFYNVSNGSIISSNAWSQSEYIPYNENTYFTISSTYLENNSSFELTQFDENKNWIKSRQFSLTTGSWVEKTENGTKYVKLGFRNDRGVELNLQLEKGSTVTEYEAFKGGSYEINLGSIELCKINDYQDYIYKSNGTWYKHKVIGKIVLDGSDTFTYGRITTNTANAYRFTIGIPNNKPITNGSNDVAQLYSNIAIGTSRGDSWYNIDGINYGSPSSSTYQDFCIYFDATKNMSVNDFKSWLSNNNVIVYYILATPTEEEITDSELISQLETISLVNGENNISSSSNNLEISEIFIKYRGE